MYILDDIYPSIFTMTERVHYELKFVDKQEFDDFFQPYTDHDIAVAYNYIARLAGIYARDIINVLFKKDSDGYIVLVEVDSDAKIKDDTRLQLIENFNQENYKDIDDEYSDICWPE